MQIEGAALKRNSGIDVDLDALRAGLAEPEMPVMRGRFIQLTEKEIKGREFLGVVVQVEIYKTSQA